MEDEDVATDITVSELKPQPSMMGSNLRTDAHGNPIVNRILNAIPESETRRKGSPDVESGRIRAALDAEVFAIERSPSNLCQKKNSKA